ncbi:MAG: hypothetical protein RMZ41_017325 [Nostoc sp. DedVER02]|nr:MULTISPECIES: hypothetical protein [unclassified Nostoc]MDZ7988800.1 hypothetical protein [Nostoc sp. DedVER02]MDZ8111631.1 hypothetical protein [Nostoc sp. DedVER01b]
MLKRPYLTVVEEKLLGLIEIKEVVFHITLQKLRSLQFVNLWGANVF